MVCECGIDSECAQGTRNMSPSRGFPTPMSWAARMGYFLVPVFLVLGLLLGACARAWMRIISTDPEFTISGSLFIVLGFSFFAAMQSIAALAAQRP